MAVISVEATKLLALILPVAEIEVADMLDTEIRPGTDILDADKFETNIEVEFNLAMVAKGVVKSVATERLVVLMFAGLKFVAVRVVAERLLMEALHILDEEALIEEAEFIFL